MLVLWKEFDTFMCEISQKWSIKPSSAPAHIGVAHHPPCLLSQLAGSLTAPPLGQIYSASQEVLYNLFWSPWAVLLLPHQSAECVGWGCLWTSYPGTVVAVCYHHRLPPPVVGNWILVSGWHLIQPHSALLAGKGRAIIIRKGRGYMCDFKYTNINIRQKHFNLKKIQEQQKKVLMNNTNTESNSFCLKVTQFIPKTFCNGLFAH